MMTGDDRMQISLTVNEWNVVLSILTKQPYEVVANLIQQMTAQAQQAQNVVPTVPLNGTGLQPIGPAISTPLESREER